MNLQANSLVVEKTPTQILDDMEKRVKTPVDSREPKRLSINYSSPNNEAHKERI